MSEKEQELKITDKRHRITGKNGGDEEKSDRIPSYVENLQKQLEANDNRMKEYIAAYKAKMLENDQFRTRLEKDVDRRVEMKIAEFMRGLLPVLDNLSLAGETAKSTNDVENVVKGIGLIRSGLLNLLRQLGMRELDCLGKEFDPAVAEAVSVEESREKEKNGKVLEVLQTGYVIGDMLLRPAKVKVGKMVEG